MPRGWHPGPRPPGLRTRDLEAEVSRVTALGTTVLTSLPAVEDGWTWHVPAHPDGNEFCALQPPPHYFLKDRDQRFNGGLLPEITRRPGVLALADRPGAAEVCRTTPRL
jgi:hypothetical protein